MKLVDLSGQEMTTQENSAENTTETTERQPLSLVTDETTDEGATEGANEGAIEGANEGADEWADDAFVEGQQEEINYHAQMQQLLLYVVSRTAQRAKLSGLNFNKEIMMQLSMESSNVIHNVMLYRIMELIGVQDLRQLVSQKDLDDIVEGFQFHNPNQIVT